MVEIRKVNWLEADEGQRARIEKRYREQVDGLVAELEGLFPTREIVSAEVKGSFKDRLNACARELGYKSWKDFARACGFVVDGAAGDVDALEVSGCVDNVLLVVGKKADDMLDKIAAWYPDGDVSTLKKDHDNSVENLSKIAQNLGYESWRELLADCGYDVSMLSGPKGGRPASNDYEAIAAELAARYEGRALPATVKQLREENPDLSSVIKTLQNDCPKLYGVKPKVFLQERGVLAGSRVKVAQDWGGPVSLEEWLGSLDERSAAALTARFGGATLEEAGEQLGVTKEAVRQLEKKLLESRPAIIQDAYKELSELDYEAFTERTGEPRLVYGYLRLVSKGSRRVGPRKAKEDPAQEIADAVAFLEELKARYDGRVREPSLSAFEAANPDFKAKSKYIKRYLSSLGTTPKAYLEKEGFISKIASPDSLPRPKREVVEAFVESLGHIGPDELKGVAPANAAWREIEAHALGREGRGSVRMYEMLRAGDPVELFVNDRMQIVIKFCGEAIDYLRLSVEDERSLMNRISYAEEYGLVGNVARAVVTEVSGGAKRPKAAVLVYFAEDRDALNVADGMYLSRDGKRLLEHDGSAGCVVSIPEGVREIAPRAFEDAELREVSLPSTLEVIGSRAFFNSGLRSVEVPSSVTSIGEAAFATCYEYYEPKCKVTKVSVAKGNERYVGKGGSLIEVCGDERRLVHAYHPVNSDGASRVAIPKGVTTIARGSLSEGLEAILTLPEGLAKIEAGVFEDVIIVDDERGIRIPASLVDVGDDFCEALFNCGEEKDVALPPDVERAFYCPFGITIDSANPRFYVEGETAYVRKWDPDGRSGGIEPAEPGETYEFSYASPSGATVTYSFDF